MSRFPQGFITIILLLFLASCFHKSNKTGEADDVTQFMLCGSPKGNFVITHEEVFHATSKSYNRGISQITGYNDYRYTVRDLHSGKLITRMVTGKRSEDVMMLGYDGNQLWCYDASDDGGIQARDPATMQVVITRLKIEEANPHLANQMSKPQSYEAEQYYSYDYLKGQIIISDLKGVFYSLDPHSLQATPLDEKPDAFPDVNYPKSGSAYLSPGRSIRMDGDLRKQLVLSDTVKTKERFLHGEIICEQDATALTGIAGEYDRAFNQTIHALRLRSDSLEAAHPFLNQHERWLNNSSDREVMYAHDALKRNIDDMERDSTNGHYEVKQFLSGCPLGIQSGSIFIVHANNVTDTSSLLISKVNWNGSTLTTEWTTLVPGIYFDPDKGIRSNPMTEVFKSGDPQFRFEQYALQAGVLCCVKMLFAFGLDANTGKLLWKEKL